MKKPIKFGDIRDGDVIRIEYTQPDPMGWRASEINWTAEARRREIPDGKYFLLERPVADYAVPVSKRRLDQLTDVLGRVDEGDDITPVVTLNRLYDAVNKFLGDLDGFDDA